MSTFYGIGVGPGNPELLTKQAIDQLKSVSRVAAPAAESSDRSMALETARPYLPESTSTDLYFFPLTGNREEVQAFWRDVAGDIEDHILRETNVAFLTLGDPGFYSTCSLVMEQLSEHISKQLIPGITSIQAAACRINHPLTKKNGLFTTLTGNQIDEIEQLLGSHDTIAVLKPNRNFSQLTQLVRDHPKVRQAPLVTRCGHANEQIIDLSDTTPEEVDYFSVLLIFTNPE